MQLNNILVHNTKLLIIKPNNYENKTFTPPIARLLLVIMICLPVWGSNAFAQTAESYVVLDNAAGTLTFKHDANKPVGAFSLNEAYAYAYPAWYAGYGGSNGNNIKRVIFDPSFANARPTNCYAWFFGCKDLTVIEGLEYLNTENVKNLNSMFCYCASLPSLDLSTFDTRNVTDMCEMFKGCSSLTSLDVSKFDTQNVTNMEWMFWNCNSLTSLDVSKFDTRNVTYMDYMFNNCSNLTSLDVSKFDTQNVTNMYAMFGGCSSLTSLDVSKFDTQNVTNMEWMFGGCSSLTSFDLSNFKTQKVRDMERMFYECRSLTSLDLSTFDTQNVTNMSNMFGLCSSLTSLDVSKFDTQNVTNMSNMFDGCSSLTSLDLSNFKTQNVTNMGNMFYNCVNLATIYASDKFVTTTCSEDDWMFRGCKKLVGAVPYDPNRVGKEMANYTTGYFTYKAASGIDAVSATDNIAAEYYDVNGRRLNAPQKGINIVKRGNRTTKVLVK